MGERDGIGEIEIVVLGGVLEIRTDLSAEPVMTSGGLRIARTAGKKGLFGLDGVGLEGWLCQFSLACGLAQESGERKAGEKKCFRAPWAWVPIEQWEEQNVAARASSLGIGSDEFRKLVGDLQEREAAARADCAFRADPHFYDGQLAAVTHEVRGSLLVVSVDLSGPAKVSDLGFAVVGYRKQWQRVDTRLWYDFGYSVRVGFTAEPQGEHRGLVDLKDRLLVKAAAQEELFAACSGVTVEQYRSRREAPVRRKKASAPGKRKGRTPEQARASRKKGAETLKERKALGWWYDEKGKKLPKDERDRRRAEIEAASERSEQT